MRTPLSTAFASAVRHRRMARGLSQEALAERADVHRTYVSAVERGRVRLGLDVAHRIALGLGVSLSALIRDAERALDRENVKR